MTQDTNGKVTNSPLDITNESQEVSFFLAGDHKAHVNRHLQRHRKHKTYKNIKDALALLCVCVWEGVMIPTLKVATLHFFAPAQFQCYEKIQSFVVILQIISFQNDR